MSLVLWNLCCYGRTKSDDWLQHVFLESQHSNCMSFMTFPVQYMCQTVILCWQDCLVVTQLFAWFQRMTSLHNMNQLQKCIKTKTRKMTVSLFNFKYFPPVKWCCSSLKHLCTGFSYYSESFLYVRAVKFKVIGWSLLGFFFHCTNEHERQFKGKCNLEMKLIWRDNNAACSIWGQEHLCV